MKKKRLLEKLRYVHNLVEQMEMDDASEDYMDKTVNAMKAIPGLNEAFAPGNKRKADETVVPDQEEAEESPLHKKKGGPHRRAFAAAAGCRLRQHQPR